NHSSDADRTSLPEMLEQLGVVHMPDELAVSVRVGGTPTELPGDAEHALLRIAGEALFNVAVHAHASRAVLRLTYRADTVLLSVSDDGDGDPARMRLILKLAATNDVDGRHRGLANMQTRTLELGGALEVRRARIGGIQILVRLPLPLPQALPLQADVDNLCSTTEIESEES
ncbi:MAG: sensor histidine kinase, partial [Rhodococcus sp. (in: high G+C Gram-positive bacteria)]|nr:sensor histidine kinase [Rhodococcus sp. (in: high G+C Gram-positive bacteria)]